MRVPHFCLNAHYYWFRFIYHATGSAKWCQFCFSGAYVGGSWTLTGNEQDKSVNNSILTKLYVSIQVHMYVFTFNEFNKFDMIFFVPAISVFFPCFFLIINRGEGVRLLPGSNLSLFLIILPDKSNFIYALSHRIGIM